MVFSLGTSASGPTSPCISESTRVRTTFGRPLRILQYRFLGSPVSCPSRITPLFLSDHYWTLRVAHIWAKRPSAPHPRNKRELFDLFRESSRENSFSHSTKTPSFIQQAFVEQTMSGSVLGAGEAKWPRLSSLWDKRNDCEWQRRGWGRGWEDGLSPSRWGPDSFLRHPTPPHLWLLWDRETYQPNELLLGSFIVTRV